MCCVLSDSIKSLKVLILKSLGISQACSCLDRSFHSFVAAYSNVDWPTAFLLSFMILYTSGRCK